MTAASPSALIQRPGEGYEASRGGEAEGIKEKILLRLKCGFTVLQDAECLVLKDSHNPNRPAYFADLVGVLHEVFKRQVNRRLIKDQRKDLAALRDAIESARAELQEVLSMKEVSKNG